MPPTVSVIMPIYNGATYVHDAVKSILVQTLQEFELIIIDNGSTDNTKEVISNINDTRISILSNNQNKGISYSLNRGIRLATGKYIARMDHDDIALPERL